MAGAPVRLLDHTNEPGRCVGGAEVPARVLSRALPASPSIETGMVSINSSSSVHLEVPFGGVEQLSMGWEQGMVAREHHSEQQRVFIARR